MNSYDMVYVDGQWLHVDVSANDLYRQHYILLAETVQGLSRLEPSRFACSITGWMNSYGA